MATNPPITIGELADVPAPGSGVKSAWCQEVTNRIHHRFATVADRDTKWPAATAGTGAVCFTLDTVTEWVVVAGVWRALAGPITPWTNLTMQNAWVSYGAGYEPQYRKIGDNVQIRGLMKSGSVSTVAFTLPVGFRPFMEQTFVTMSNSVFAGISIAGNGTATVQPPSPNAPAYFYLGFLFSTVA